MGKLFTEGVCKEEFEDTELAIRNSISEKVWQHTGQKKKDKQRSMKHYLGSKASCKQSFVLYYHTRGSSLVCQRIQP
jgi:hypothetical protein